MPTAELADRLSISTAEVNTIESRGPADEDGNHGLFLVGKVLEAGKHPNADRLQLCQVDVGEGGPRQIVCGAWNFGAGATVAVALPGARLPGADAPLGEAKLRGEVSRGMILSERELELGADHAGIMVLPETEPGTPLADVLPLADSILEVDPTGNRVDLLSVYGLAREVAALFGLELAAPPGVDPGAARDRDRRHPHRRPRAAAPATSAAPSPAFGSGPRRRGCGRASRGPGCARSPTWSTSRTTSCSRSEILSTPSTARRSPAIASSYGGRNAARSSGRSTASTASSTSAIS